MPFILAPGTGYIHITPILLRHTDRLAWSILGRERTQPLVVLAKIAAILVATIATVWDSITLEPCFLQLPTRTVLFITEVKAVPNNSVAPLLLWDALLLENALPLARRTPIWKRDGFN